ncbi:hypothetical protein GJU40_12940 [Bacillus lacus]|uniref:Transposase n=1 Tax=Metabacillus lacus TaxID=1983721 RepID=A0A7X2J0V0_9BACI|nr:hypothetical protein [Metabacillus lacus]MRX73047.1 hypothetical protein [Metabacillus lacus]
MLGNVPQKVPQSASRNIPTIYSKNHIRKDFKQLVRKTFPYNLQKYFVFGFNWLLHKQMDGHWLKITIVQHARVRNCNAAEQITKTIGTPTVAYQ